MKKKIKTKVQASKAFAVTNFLKIKIIHYQTKSKNQ
jgi:hypothetical protein